ncbi:hypothetical protein ACP70R_038230 [Stipagrostis hirtigluma subsp. patula]
MVRRLRKAYQKVFMPSATSQSSFEDRLAELNLFVCRLTKDVVGFVNSEAGTAHKCGNQPRVLYLADQFCC